jgi:diadenylate cyclase
MGVWDPIADSLAKFEASSVIDVLSITILIYLTLLLLKGTTAIPLLRGVAMMLLGAVVLAAVLDLTVLDWVIRNSFPAVLIVIPIVFQPEIRRFLLRVGRTGGFPWAGRHVYEGIVDVVADAALNLSKQGHGAIMVLEREAGLEDYVDTGVKVDAVPTVRLLEGIFFPNSPLHDGAVIIKEDRVAAASCTLPVSDRTDVALKGLRHRAAMGISERTDAVAVVVSEETGDISVAASGRMIGGLDGPRLRGILRSLLVPASELDRPTRRRLPGMSR